MSARADATSRLLGRFGYMNCREYRKGFFVARLTSESLQAERVALQPGRGVSTNIFKHASSVRAALRAALRPLVRGYAVNPPIEGRLQPGAKCL